MDATSSQSVYYRTCGAIYLLALSMQINCRYHDSVASRNHLASGALPRLHTRYLHLRALHQKLAVVA